MFEIFVLQAGSIGAQGDISGYTNHGHMYNCTVLWWTDTLFYYADTTVSASYNTSYPGSNCFFNYYIESNGSLLIDDSQIPPQKNARFQKSIFSTFENFFWLR